eukprot:GHVN01011209.1.p2 GENE.GHVN01011209.1~~GHVN01011209.1.p2  ORF type:complete len:117 (-),score=23.27 GHVN01011209.1:869-1219(-)
MGNASTTPPNSATIRRCVAVPTKRALLVPRWFHQEVNPQAAQVALSLDQVDPPHSLHSLHSLHPTLSWWIRPATLGFNLGPTQPLIFPLSLLLSHTPTTHRFTLFSQVLSVCLSVS